MTSTDKGSDNRSICSARVEDRASVRRVCRNVLSDEGGSHADGAGVASRDGGSHLKVDRQV